MSEIVRRTEKYVDVLIKLLPLLSFIVPFSILYSLYPATFEMTWEGRTYYLFFLWLMLLETILNWEELRERWRSKSTRTIFFIITLALPTIYVIGANYYGWNAAFLELTERSNVSFYNFMPLTIEYLVFTVLFVVIAFAGYGLANLRNYSITALFLGAIGTIYAINNLYPYGHFTPFQILVPATTVLAAGVLNMMGYVTSISYAQNLKEGSLPVLSVPDYNVSFKIAWPCSGVESLVIYSVTILLFLKNSAIPWKHRLVYFIFGAAITYFINALRIVTIFLIAMGGGDFTTFHDYYGQLYSISWIVSYPIIIMGSRVLWERIVSRKASFESEHSLPYTPELPP